MCVNIEQLSHGRGPITKDSLKWNIYLLRLETMGFVELKSSLCGMLRVADVSRLCSQIQGMRPIFVTERLQKYKNNI